MSVKKHSTLKYEKRKRKANLQIFFKFWPGIKSLETVQYI